MEKPLYPSPYMRITQGYGVGSHRDSYAIDEAGMDTGIDNIKAPFTGVIKKIYTSDANEVWLESSDKVEYPDGTIDYMTVLFAHDNDVSNLFIGKTINRGEVFYQEGTKGNASGNHCHIECGRGRFTGTGWYKNSNGNWSINNGKKPEECFWVDDSIRILNSNGYTFKRIEPEIPNVPVPEDNKPKPEPEPTDNSTQNPSPEDSKPNDSQGTVNKPTTSKPRLIFTCRSDDIYAIELKKGQKLYLE